MNNSKLVDEAGVLKNAAAYSFAEFPDELAAIELEFEHFTCSINVVEDSDEITINLPSNTKNLIRSSKELIFHKCIGSSVIWNWRLINNQDYSDGLKFEFNNGTVFELLVICSSIKQYTVNKL